MRGDFAFQTTEYSQLINIRVENLVNEANRRRFIWIRIGKLHADFPNPAFIKACNHRIRQSILHQNAF